MKAFRTVLLCLVSWRFVASEPALRCGVLWGRNVCSPGRLPAGSLLGDFSSPSFPQVKLASAFPKLPKPDDNISIVKVTRKTIGGGSSTPKPRAVKLSPNKSRPSRTPIDTLQALSSYNIVNHISERPRAVKFAAPISTTRIVHGIPPDDIADFKIPFEEPVVKIPFEEPVVKIPFDEPVAKLPFEEPADKLPFEPSADEKLRNYYQFLSSGTFTSTSPPIKFSTPSFHVGPSTANFPTIKVPTFKVPAVTMAPIKIPHFKFPATPAPIKFPSVTISPISLPASRAPSEHTVRIPAVSFPAVKPTAKLPKESSTSLPPKDSAAKEPAKEPAKSKAKPIKTLSSLFDDDDGTLSLASSAPVRDNSPEASNYEYDYDSSPQQVSQEPQESASHYDAYIQDVQSAATGDNNKKGFSRGSGLRTIAVGSANQAKTALGNQAAAAYQAAYVAKNTLAQSASQASATAQAALAGKQVILSGLEQQVRDAKVALQGEEMQLQQAKRSAQSAAQSAQQAMHQVNVIQAALNAAQATSENANEAASQAAGELGAQTAMVGAARQRLQTLQEQLHGVRIDFDATQSAARKAQAAAQQAQANAAAAAAKAAAAGLGKQDSSHEGTAYQEYKVAPAPEQNSQEYYTLQSDFQHQ